LEPSELGIELAAAFSLPLSPELAAVSFGVREVRDGRATLAPILPGMGNEPKRQLGTLLAVVWVVRRLRLGLDGGRLEVDRHVCERVARSHGTFRWM
jgi:hypothetical protein